MLAYAANTSQLEDYNSGRTGKTKGSSLGTLEGMCLPKHNLPLGCPGLNKEKERRGRKDGNGQVPRTDLEYRRGQAARALGSGRQVARPRKLKISSMIGRIVIL